MNGRKSWLRLGAIILMLAALTVLPVWTVRSSRQSSHAKTVIAIAKTRDFSVAFWAALKNGMEEAGREFGVDVDYRAPISESDVDGQIVLLDQAIAEAPDAILLAANDRQRLLEPVLRAKNAGIPVIMFDSSIDYDADVPFVTLVATDNIKAGQLLAETILTDVAPGSKIAIMSHNVNTTSGSDRESGIRRVIDASYQVLPTIDCAGSRARAVREAAGLLQNDALAAVVCTNEYTVSAMLEAMKAMPRTDLILVGFDTSYEMMDALEMGTLGATVIQRAFNMGYLAVDKAVQHLNGQALDLFYDSTSALITREVMYAEENAKLLFPFSQGSD
jgi:ribose transport system substrate-binding protein